VSGSSIGVMSECQTWFAQQSTSQVAQPFCHPAPNGATRNIVEIVIEGGATTDQP